MPGEIEFHVDTDTPIAFEVLRSAEKLQALAPQDAGAYERALLGQVTFGIGAIAELERRVIALEEIVRAGMGPRPA